MKFGLKSNYVTDFKEKIRTADTKKAGCGDRLFSCVRQLKKPLKLLNCWFHFSGLSAYTQ